MMKGHLNCLKHFSCLVFGESAQDELDDNEELEWDVEGIGIGKAKQMINEPTRCTMNTETLIDLAFVSDESKIANSFTVEYAIVTIN